MRNIQHIQQPDKCILSIKAGIHQPVPLISPFGKSSLVEAFLVVFNDKGNDIIFETFLECDQPANSSIPVLKRMDELKFCMELNNVLNCYNVLS